MRQRRWMELLHEYNFTIEYHPGKEIAVADALSRKSLAATISLLLQRNIADLIRQSSRTNPFYNRIVSILLVTNKSEKDLCIIEGFHLEEGLLYYKGRVYIPADKELKLNILTKAHNVPTAAHPGYIKTYNTLRKSFYWHGLKRDVLAYVTRCLTCQQIKAK